MDSGSARRLLIENSFLLPPLDIFEPLEKNSAIEMVLKNSDRLAEDNENFYEWISGIRGEIYPAFHGSSLRTTEACDVDVISFSIDGGLVHYRKPKFVHVLETRKTPDGIESKWGPLLLSGLLFTEKPPDFLIGLIEKNRHDSLSQPFLEGGIGETIPYAAFKALKSRPLFTADEWDLIKDIRIKLQKSWNDFTNMQVVHYTPPELNYQIRRQMESLDDEKLSVLTKAAIRRLRIKIEKQNELAERFIHDLRQRKLRGYFG